MSSSFLWFEVGISGDDRDWTRDLFDLYYVARFLNPLKKIVYGNLGHILWIQFSPEITQINMESPSHCFKSSNVPLFKCARAPQGILPKESIKNCWSR